MITHLSIAWYNISLNIFNFQLLIRRFKPPAVRDVIGRAMRRLNEIGKREYPPLSITRITFARKKID